LNLLRFIDWLIRLPRALELELRDELRALEEETSMAYVMIIERLAREEGWEEGREEGREEGEKHGEAKALLRQLQVKFGPPEPAVAARIAAAESAQVERWLERILTANSPDELFE
jgi:predicted transposase YdaD